jgi:hypothetical protein
VSTTDDALVLCILICVVQSVVMISGFNESAMLKYWMKCTGYYDYSRRGYALCFIPQLVYVKWRILHPGGREMDLGDGVGRCGRAAR